MRSHGLELNSYRLNSGQGNLTVMNLAKKHPQKWKLILVHLPYSANFSRRTIFTAHVKLKCFAETIFADQRTLLAMPFYLRLFAVPDQSAKNVKMMRLENLALLRYIHVAISHAELSTHFSSLQT